MDIWSAKDFFVVTPTNNTAIGAAKAIYVGTGGTLRVRKEQGGSTIDIVVPSGGLLPIGNIWSIDDTGTDADDILRLI